MLATRNEIIFIGHGNIYLVIIKSIGKQIQNLNLVSASQTFNLLRNNSQINTKWSEKLKKKQKKG